MGADIICIKDMANLLLPYKAYSLIKRLKAETNLPIVLHTHDTTGTGAMTLLKAVEAGVDIDGHRAFPTGQRHLPARHRVPGGHAAGHATMTPAWTLSC